MRQLLSCLSFVVAVILLLSSAVRLSTAFRLFKRPKDAELSTRIAMQLQLNAHLKTGLKAGEPTKLKEFLKYIRRKLRTQKFVFLYPYGAPRDTVDSQLWKGLQRAAPCGPKEVVTKFCRSVRTLIIGTDVEKLTKIHEELTKIHEEQLDPGNAKPHNCLVALSSDNFKDLTLRSVPILHQTKLNDFVTNMKQISESKPKPKTGGLLRWIFFRRRVCKGEDQAKCNPRALVQFLVERGIKALVFGFERTAISGASLNDPLTNDFKEVAKLVKDENLFLYIATFTNEESAEAFEIYQQRVVEVLKMNRIYRDEILADNPSFSNTEYLTKIRKDKNLQGEEIVLIDNNKVNVQRALSDGYLAIHVAGEDGFDLLTLEIVKPLLPQNKPKMMMVRPKPVTAVTPSKPLARRLNGKPLPLQFQLNGKLKTGWTGTRKEFVEYLEKVLLVKHMVILSATSVELKHYSEELKRLDWGGLVPLTLRARLFSAKMLDKTPALVIGSDFNRLRNIYYENMPHCIVALGTGLFPDFKPRSVPILTQTDLNDFVTKMNSERQQMKEMPTSPQMLLQFLVDRGVKALVFVSRDNLETLLTRDFQEVAKIVNTEGLLLYIISFNQEEYSEEFLDEQRELLQGMLAEKEIFVTRMIFVNPPRGTLPRTTSITKYLKKLKEKKRLYNEEILLIDNDKQNVQRAVSDGLLAIHATGENGFELATVCEVAPLPPPRSPMGTPPLPPRMWSAPSPRCAPPVPPRMPSPVPSLEAIAEGSAQLKKQKDSRKLLGRRRTKLFQSLKKRKAAPLPPAKAIARMKSLRKGTLPCSTVAVKPTVVRRTQSLRGLVERHAAPLPPAEVVARRKPPKTSPLPRRNVALKPLAKRRTQSLRELVESDAAPLLPAEAAAQMKPLQTSTLPRSTVAFKSLAKRRAQSLPAIVESDTAPLLPAEATAQMKPLQTSTLPRSTVALKSLAKRRTQSLRALVESDAARLPSEPQLL